MLDNLLYIPNTTEALSVGIPSVLASILAFVKWYLPWQRKSKVKNQSLNELRSIQKIYSIMHEMISETASERVVIFHGHDSGEIPKAGSPYYISSIYWKVRHDACYHDRCIDVAELDSKTHQDISDYKEVSVDSHYIDMLLDIQEQDTVRIKTDDLPAEHCMLRSFYEMEGVADSMVIYLGYSKNNLMFMSVATFRDEGFSDDDIIRLKLKSSAIKKELGFK
ncbi:MAG: hypothetical protein OEV22_18035 [Deltaproteobacteria bacterium]|jgi:hypothetical protein|nr:hypothetical protein [Deltaproteobacteria bacterium]